MAAPTTPVHVTPWLSVAVDACSRQYEWFEAQARSGTPVQYILSCVEAPHRALAPVKYGHERELHVPEDTMDTDDIGRDAWAKALRFGKDARARGIRLLIHSPDGHLAALLGAALAVELDGDADAVMATLMSYWPMRLVHECSELHKHPRVVSTAV
jgi:hypothetical protein